MKKNILSMGIETFFFENCALKCRCLHPASFPALRPLPPKGRTAWQPALCQFLLWRNFFCGVWGQCYGTAVFVQCGAPEYCGEKGGPARQRRGKGGEGQRAAGPEFKKAGGFLQPACTAHEKGAAGPVWTMGKPFVCGKPDKKGKALSRLPSRNVLPYTES